MKKQNLKNVICQALAVSGMILPAISVQAISIDWGGNYRIEYVDVDRTSLDDPKLHKSYILNHLSLSPKIIAADGVNIVGRFEILSNDLYPDSQAGQVFGRGPTKATAGTSSSADDSAVAGSRHGDSDIKVNQLYLNINQEYGSLVAGRAPLDFGLGINHNAGNGPFDHWYDTRDMVGYRFMIGNFSLMPILGKVSDYSVAQGRDVQDLIWDVEYNNPETESAIAIMHQTRSSSTESNDAPATGYGGATIGSRWNTQNVGIFISRGFEDVKIKVEAGFESGPTGIKTAADEEVKLNGYGIALEVEVPQPQSRWHWNFRAGIASGDNPTTTNYEGFQFHRNYDVAMLMFNHPLGQADFLRSAVQRSPDRLNGVASPYATDEALDDEVISNALYVSPKVVYNINDKWDWNNTLTWAQLQTEPIAGVGMAKDLGFEWDTGLTYHPHERIQWVNEVGLLFPGSAWVGGSNDYGKDFTLGFTSKAAISF